MHSEIIGAYLTSKNALKLVVPMGCVSGAWVLAYSGSGELHQVLTAARLWGGCNHCFFSTGQLHLKSMGIQSISNTAPIMCPPYQKRSKQLLTVVDLLGPCQHPVPCSYFITKYLLSSGPAQDPHTLYTCKHPHKNIQG